MVQNSEVWGGHDTANGLHSRQVYLALFYDAQLDLKAMP
jgi:hypothetical protein